jgi:DNA-binding transcriptional ArsR family regulator
MSDDSSGAEVGSRGVAASTRPGPGRAAPSSDLDDLFDALANETRRRTIRLVADRDGPVDRDEIASALGPAEADRAGTTLHHVHLPVLDEADVLRYDPETGGVTPGATLDVARDCLASFEERADGRD